MFTLYSSLPPQGEIWEPKAETNKILTGPNKTNINGEKR